MAKTKKKNKQLGQLVILAVVLVALVGALFLGKYLNAKAEEEEAAALLVTIDLPCIDDPTTLVMYDGSNSETYIYDADSGSWLWAEDTSFPLNDNYITQLLNTWSVTSAESELEITDTLEAYGLEPAQCSATITNDAGESMTILVGNYTGSYYYAMIEGGESIYLISSSIYSYLQYGLYDMATKATIPSISSDTLAEISVTLADGETTIVLTQTLTEVTTIVQAEDEDEEDEEVTETVSSWALADGTDITEADNLSELTSELIGLSFDALYNYAADEDALAACGLDNPVTVVITYTVTETDDDENTITTTESFTILIGNQTEDGSYYYVRLLDSTWQQGDNIEVYQVEFSDLTTLMAVVESGSDALFSEEQLAEDAETEDEATDEGESQDEESEETE